MSKAVMISIHPEWCQFISAGIKSIEVRKTRPKLETPFKCYIYCTKPKHSGAAFMVGGNRSATGSGKVIGEFTCDRIYQYSTCNAKGVDISHEDMEGMSCLTRKQLEEYEFSAEAKDFEVYNIGLYGWHISDLVIYDKPKELGEFIKPCIFGEENGSCLLCDKSGYTPDMHIDCFNVLTRPPQSWCYVEDL